MNLIIPPAATGPVKGAGGAAAPGAGASAKGGGFAGALVQALGGTNAQQGNAGGLNLPIAYTALVMAGGDTAAGTAGNSASELLAALIQRLQPLQQNQGQNPDKGKDAAATPSDALAQLLAGLQSLLQQLVPGATPQAEAAGTQTEPQAQTPQQPSADGTANAVTAPVLALLVPALQQTLQQLDAVLSPQGAAGTQAQTAPASATPTAQASAAAIAAALAPLAPALQQMQQQLAAAPSASAAQPLQSGQNGNGAVPSAAANPASAPAAPLPSLLSNLQTTLQQLLAGTDGTNGPPPTVTVVQAEANPPAPSFKEPLMFWHAGNAASDAPASEPAKVPAAGEDQRAGGQPETLPWATPTPQQVAAQATQPQAALPAQVPAQQFAQQVGPYLVKQFALSGGNGTTEAKLTLHPAQLGQVDVRIVMQNGQMTAEFVTHSSAAKELLENQMGTLRSTLQNQGIDVQRMEVVQQQNLTGSTAFQGQEQRQSGSGGSGGDAGRRHRGESYEDPLGFEAELERTNVLREAGYGSALNVTA